MKTWRDMIDEKWRISIDPLNAEAEVLRLDKTDRGAMIGPLATVPVGETQENDDGETLACMDDEDGRNLCAIVALPRIAALLCWTADELDKLNGVHFDGSTEAGKFHNELRARTMRLLNLVDQREPTMCEGDCIAIE